MMFVTCLFKLSSVLYFNDKLNITFSLMDVEQKPNLHIILAFDRKEAFGSI